METLYYILAFLLFIVIAGKKQINGLFKKVEEESSTDLKEATNKFSYLETVDDLLKLHMWETGTKPSVIEIDHITYKKLYKDIYENNRFAVIDPNRAVRDHDVVVFSNGVECEIRIVRNNNLFQIKFTND